MTALPHSYATDLDALRAIVTLYTEAATESVRDYYAACAAQPGLFDPFAPTGDMETALRELSFRTEAASVLQTIWAQSCARPTLTIGDRIGRVGHDCNDPGRAAFLRTAAADVLERLRGDMGRAMPLARPAETQAETQTETQTQTKEADQ